MMIELRHAGVPVSDALHDFAIRRLSRALRPFEEAVSRADVRISDLNGPRGGIDIECRVSVALAPLDQPVIVTGKGADPYAAVIDATARLHEAVSRALGRRRSARAGAPLPGTKAQRDESASRSGKAAGPGGDIVITAIDQQRLRRLIEASRDTRDHEAADILAEELDRAEVVPAERIAGNVVTMNSRIVFRDEAAGESREISLVYPQDSDPERGRISIFAPVGTALLGLSVGQTIDWPLPQGRFARYRVVEIVYQPEAAGHLQL